MINKAACVEGGSSANICTTNSLAQFQTADANKLFHLFFCSENVPNAHAIADIRTNTFLQGSEWWQTQNNCFRKSAV